MLADILRDISKDPFSYCDMFMLWFGGCAMGFSLGCYLGCKRA